MKDPNFVLIDKFDNQVIFEKLHNILISQQHTPLLSTVFNVIMSKPDNKAFADIIDLTLISIDKKLVNSIFNLFTKFEDLDLIINKFSFESISCYALINKKDDKIDFGDLFSLETINVKGIYNENSINYLFYLLILFYKHEKAFIEIFKFDVTRNEFGKLNLIKWDAKFKIFFNDFIVKLKTVDGKNFLDFSNKINAMKNKFIERKFGNDYFFFNEIYKDISSFFFNLTEIRATEVSFSTDHQTKQQKGISFENDCLEVLRENKWNVQNTPKTNDQGADLIANKGLLKIIFQCKNYKSPVGNDAIQQVLSAKQYYQGRVAAVISNSGFTNSARSLAKKTEVLLMDINDLKQI